MGVFPHHDHYLEPHDEEDFEDDEDPDDDFWVDQEREDRAFD